MDAATLEAKLLAIIAEQRQQGESWRASSYYTPGGHNVGDDVCGAAVLALATVRDMPRRGDAAAYHAALYAALHGAHQMYREEAEDPDGYGSATFHEILRGLNALVSPE
jgi:hypothetical protein